jgi:pimeloyl-ACP methyl ester carboxylesterase
LSSPDIDQYPGFKEDTFDAGEVQLNFAEGPDNGPPLVLLHGLGRRWQVFEPLIPTLSQNWHIYAPDLRGHGESTRIPRGYRGAQYAKDVIAFLEQRVPLPAILFGHSLGGMVGLWIAAHHPAMVRALILGDSMLLSKGFEPDTMYPMLFAGLRDLASRDCSIEELAQGLAKIRLKVPGLNEAVPIGDLPGNDMPHLLRWACCVKQVDPDAFAMTLDGSSLQGWDGEALLHQVCCPALLLQGNPELGALMSDADVERAQVLLPDPVHVRFATLGHALYIQQPEPVLRAVTSFLESLITGQLPPHA